MDYKSYIVKILYIQGATEDEIYSFIEIPPDTSMGDFALPCFKLSKILRKSNPKVITCFTMAKD